MPAFETNILTLFAADYDCNAYGQGTYNNNACATQTADSGAPTGGLADTGYDIIIPIALGLALIIAGGILLVKKLRRRVGTQKK